VPPSLEPPENLDPVVELLESSENLEPELPANLEDVDVENLFAVVLNLVPELLELLNLVPELLVLLNLLPVVSSADPVDEKEGGLLPPPPNGLRAGGRVIG